MRNKKYCKQVISALTIILMMGTLFTGCSSKNKDTDKNVTAGESQTKTESNSTTPASTENKDETTTADSFVHDSNLNEVGQFPICKEKVSLVIGVPQNANVEDWETNFQTKMLEEKCNVDLSFKVYPSDEYLTQINLNVAAGGEELPDILINNGDFGDDLVYSWGQAGAIIPLTDYYNNSAFYLSEAVDRTGVDFKPMITSPDGNIYYIPIFNQSLTNEYPAKIWMYQPWLDTLKLQVPTTPEELRTVLKAFKEQDPNGNGIADEVPLISSNSSNYYWFEALMTPFQWIPGNATSTQMWFQVNDGIVSPCFNTEEYREGLQYLRSLFDEGLIDPLSFTNDSSQTSAMLAQEETIIGTYVDMAMGAIPATDKRRALYSGIAPLKSEDGTQYTPYCPSVAYAGGLVTSKCENPEAAFRLLDYLISEEVSIHTRWGEKGVDWLEPEAGEKSMYDSLGYAAVLKSVLPWGQPQNKHWQQTGPYIRQYSIALGSVWDGNELQTGYQVSKIQGEYTDKHPDEVIPKLIYTKEESEVISSIMPIIDSYVKEKIGYFCTNTSGQDIYKDEVWKNYLGELETIGLSDAMKVVQTAYDRMYK